MKNVAIIIPVYNRVKVTLTCLNHLAECRIFDWADVIVVDDQSTDGTADAICSQFPQVILLEGNGDLWWAGGINMGMQYAYDFGAEYLLWLNDDCVPRGNAISALYKYSLKHDVIAVGQAFCPSGHYYGGHKKTWLGLRLLSCSESDVVPCDAFGGNAVCLPRKVVDAIGYLDAKRIPMAPADADYGLRARRKGIQAFVVGTARFENDDNLSDEQQSWLLGDIPPAKIWNGFFGKKSSRSFGPMFTFYLRHWGPWGGILFVTPYVKFLLIAFVRTLVPVSVLRKVYGARSKAWGIHSHYRAD
ncbi:glycosyltransferase family 2 protein [Verrucomicrobia bacterium S94]|nr:glycosyltransferase family 2 protein [Verrucomicrobia bacterium S94]